MKKEMYPPLLPIHLELTKLSRKKEGKRQVPRSVLCSFGKRRKKFLFCVENIF